VNLKEYKTLFLFGGLLTAMLISNVLGFVSWRYRLHNVIPLAILSAYGMAFLKIKTIHSYKSEKGLTSKLLGYCFTVILPLVICGWIAFQPLKKDYHISFYQRASANDNLSKNAEQYIQRLSELEKSTSQSTVFDASKAILFKKIHRHTKAYRLLTSLNEKKIFFPSITSMYLTYLLWLGEYDKAVQLMNDAININPKFATKIESDLMGVEKRAYQAFVKPNIY
jgi:hypothetical protein